MLKGWKFEAFMIFVVVVMLGQLLDQETVMEPVKVDTVELPDYPQA
jgi:hypothetical protein